MAWDDVPAKLVAYDAMEYADNSNGTTASHKLLVAYNAPTLNDVPVVLRGDFENDLDYRMGACENLAKSKAWPADWLRR